MRKVSRYQPRKIPWALLLLSWMGVRCTAQTEGEYARGMAAFRAREYPDAASLFAKAETAAPGTTDALIYEANSLLHLHEFSVAQTARRRDFGRHTDSDEALYFLSFVLHREKKLSERMALNAQ